MAPLWGATSLLMAAPTDDNYKDAKCRGICANCSSHFKPVSGRHIEEGPAKLASKLAQVRPEHNPCGVKTTSFGQTDVTNC